MNDIHKDVNEFEARQEEVSTSDAQAALDAADYGKLITREDLLNIFTLLHDEYNVDFSQFRLTTIVRQVRRLLMLHRLNTLDEFYQLLKQDNDVLNALKSALLVNVSAFFRDAEAFQQLNNSVITTILQRTLEDHTIRIWSVGCSTGEEAISIAIQFFEQMETLGIKRHIRIFATDVDDQALKIAKLGVYPLSIDKDVPADILARYFDKKDDGYVVRNSIRRCVLFARHNIMKDPSFSKLDFISCRNILIYFVPSMQRQVLSTLTFALKDRGFLFTGMSESVHGFSYYYDVVHERSRLYCKIKRPALMHNNAQSVIPCNPFAGHSQQFSDFAQSSKQELKSVDHEKLLSCVIQSSINPQLLSVWMPPSILVDSYQRVVYIYGDISPFVRKITSGRVMNYYQSLLRKPLAHAIEHAIERAIESNDVVQMPDVQLIQSGKADLSGGQENSSTGIISEKIDLRVDVLATNDFDEMFSVISFINYRVNSDVVLEKFKPAHREKILEYSKALKRIDVLENELLQSREFLKLTVEELEVTNEELQTSNEELLSANEELQSMNEELGELNSGFQEQIESLKSVHQDSLKLLNATGLAVVFLDEQLRIKSFTFESTRYFNIVEHDIGRPLNHFSHYLKLHDLYENIYASLSGKILQMSVSLSEPLSGYVCLTLRPYFKDDKILGSVIVLYPESRSCP